MPAASNVSTVEIDCKVSGKIVKLNALLYIDAYLRDLCTLGQISRAMNTEQLVWLRFSLRHRFLLVLYIMFFHRFLYSTFVSKKLKILLRYLSVTYWAKGKSNLCIFFYVRCQWFLLLFSFFKPTSKTRNWSPIGIWLYFI